jgi:hypothetical protein
MKKISTLAVIPICAGFLFAQQGTETRTTKTTTTSWDGTLVDAGCRTTRTERTERNTDPNTNSTTTTRTETNKTECPVTTSSTSFGLLTSDGRYIRFDDPSNSKVVKVIKSNKKWNKYMTDRTPMKVHVVGTENGDVLVVESID